MPRCCDHPSRHTQENCADEQARNAFNCIQRAHQNSLEASGGD
jgi:hypothetical protein